LNEKNKEQRMLQYKIKISDELSISDSFLRLGIKCLQEDIEEISCPNLFIAFYNFSVGIERLQKVIIRMTMKIDENCKVFDEIINQLFNDKSVEKNKMKKLIKWIKDNKDELSKHCITNYSAVKEGLKPKLFLCIDRMIDILNSLSYSHDLLELHGKIKNVELTKEEEDLLNILTQFYNHSRYENFNLFEDGQSVFSSLTNELLFDDENIQKQKIIDSIKAITKKYFSLIKEDRVLKIWERKYIFDMTS